MFLKLICLIVMRVRKRPCKGEHVDRPRLARDTVASLQNNIHQTFLRLRTGLAKLILDGREGGGRIAKMLTMFGEILSRVET
jgi:predicted alpha/beta-hydrolase family hydrolase